MKLNPIGPNCTEIDLCDGVRVLFSYKTPVAYRQDGKCYRTDCRWSNTTTRHINRWLDGRDAEEVPQSALDALLVKS